MNTTDHLSFEKRAARTVLAGAAVAAAFLALTACESNSHTGRTPAAMSTTAAAASATPAQGQYDPAALQMLDAIVHGDWGAVTAHFDSLMLKRLPPDELASSWDDYQQAFGAYQSHGDPEDVPVGNLTVVNVPLQMQHQPGQLRVTFHDKDGKVAGLFFLKTGVPVPGS